MKPRLLVLPLAAILLLSGCSSMLQRSYSSWENHVEYSSTEDSSILRAETYRGLVDAILYFVNEHDSQGVIRLYNYTTDVEADLDSACQEVIEEDPLTAFAVENITYDFSRIISYYEVTVSFAYSHTVQEVEAIQSAADSSDIQSHLRRAMADFSSSLVLWVSRFTGDEDSIRAMAAKAYYDTPQAAFGMPGIQVSLYPDTGSQRIIAIDLQWSDDPANLAQRSEELLQIALQLLTDHPPAGEQYTPAELTALLGQAALSPDPSGASDPYSALTGESSNQLAYTLALELLFQQAGIDATLVFGVEDSSNTCWLIVSVGESYRHLLFSEDGPQLLTDLEMTSLGYLWDTELYPSCADYSADLSGDIPAEP